MGPLTKDSLIWPDLIIWQKKKGYRFSMDSVILARLADIRPDDSVLEIGTGSGIVLLLTAREKNFKEITGVEIQRDLFKLAQKNFRVNGLSNRARLVNADITKFAAKTRTRFDVILCNPPYYPKGSGRVPKEREELIARHEIKITLASLISASSTLLGPGGRLYLVIPAERVAELYSAMCKHRIEPKFMLPIYPKRDGNGNLAWVKGVKGGKPGLTLLPPLICYKTGGRQTKELQNFYRCNNQNIKKTYPSIFKKGS